MPVNKLSTEIALRTTMSPKSPKSVTFRFIAINACRDRRSYRTVLSKTCQKLRSERFQAIKRDARLRRRVSFKIFRFVAFHESKQAAFAGGSWQRGSAGRESAQRSARADGCVCRVSFQKGIPPQKVNFRSSVLRIAFRHLVGVRKSCDTRLRRANVRAEVGAFRDSGLRIRVVCNCIVNHPRCRGFLTIERLACGATTDVVFDDGFIKGEASPTAKTAGLSETTAPIFVVIVAVAMAYVLWRVFMKKYSKVRLGIRNLPVSLIPYYIYRIFTDAFRFHAHTLLYQILDKDK
ncbi:hypothetical protein G5I_11614 [Acromyrmex echinatior]|uniref:Uncharacterized protein n=1 Tax=Acromyrmex echinatior TaxID=103372 RepID=F4X032_ACREC|nr:hypothetical protein G5I_11614 [Acromyrmex echinatior]